MRFIMFMYPQLSDEEWSPSADDVEEMGRYNDELRKAGVMLSGEGLHPPQTGAHVSFSTSGEATVIDGPFAEAKEVVGGYWMLDLRSPEEAVEWARRVPGKGCTVEVRRVFEVEDFPPDVQEAAARA
jgi:hypothetical protein